MSHYGIVTIFSGAIGFLSLPFFTRYLTPGDYGILALFHMFGTLTTQFISVGIGEATTRYYYKEKDNLTYFGSLNFTNFTFLIIGFALGGLVVWISADTLSINLFDRKISREIVMLSYLSGCLFKIYAYLSGLLIPQERSLSYALTTGAFTLINTLMAIILILFYSLTFYARIYSILFTTPILIVALIYLQRTYFRQHWSWAALKRSLTFSYPFVPGTIIGLVHQSFDKTMLTHVKGLMVVGHYQIAQRIGELNKMLITVVSQAWAPYFMHKAELGTEQAKDEIVARYLEVVMIFNYSSVLICCFSEEIVRLLTTEAFYPAMYIVPIIVMYILLSHLLSAIAKLQVVFAEKLLFTLPGAFTALVVNLGLNIILIPKYGAIGAALATAVASLTSNVILFYYGQKYYPLPIYYRKLVGQFFLFSAFLIPVYWLMFVELPLWLKVVVKLPLLGFYFFLTLQLSFISWNRLVTVYNRLIKNNKLSIE